MGKLDEAIEESEDASDKDKQAAREGRNMMAESASSGNDAVADDGSGGAGGSGGAAGSINVTNDLADIKKNVNIANKFIEKGGVSGSKRDNYDISIAYNEWINARNNMKTCPNKLKESSIRYVALVDGKASENEIQTMYKTKEQIKKDCENAPNILLEKATIYLEVDRRVKENQKAEQNKMPIEGFQFRSELGPINKKSGFSVYEKLDDGNDIFSGITGIVGDTTVEEINKEGFDWYRGKPRSSGVTIENPRLPLYTEQNTNTGPGTGILKWDNFYTNCKIQGDPAIVASCESAMNNKNTYIKAINNLFFEADTLINVLYQLNTSGGSSGSNSGGVNSSDNAERIKVLKQVVDKQASEIDIYKQKAQYSYEEYNSLAGIESTLLFIYYALVIIYVTLFLRDWFLSRMTFDIRNVILLLVIVFYPNFILPLVLWCLAALNKFIHLLGIKNIQFWW
jgi:hypothetical protein